MRKDKEKFDKQILLKYLRNANKSESEGVIRHWLGSPAAGQEVYEESLRFWDTIPMEQQTEEYIGEDVLDRIHHRIKVEEGIFLNRNNRKKSLTSSLSRIAAVLFIPLLITSLVLFVKSFKNEDVWAEIHAPYGTRTDFRLPDGSTGYLNGGSAIQFPVQFRDKVRKVKLTGEACFDVISNKKRPFIVSTKEIEVKATGTLFNVMAYPDERTTEVTLINGKVEVIKKGENRSESMGTMNPDELFVYDSESGSCEIHPAKSTDRLSWIDGKLIFKYEPFDEVVRKLNRWYNVNIVIQDTVLKSYTYYGSFQNETLDEVLKLLQYTAPITYKDLERGKKPDGTFEKRKVEIFSKN